MIRAIHSYQPDIFITNATWGEVKALPTLIFLRIFYRKVPIFSVYHNGSIYPKAYKNLINRAILRLFARLFHTKNIFVSNHVKSYWKLPGKVISYPISIGAASDNSPSKILNGKIRIGFLGRLSHEKGADIFCQVANSILSTSSDCTFTIGGTGALEPHLIKNYPNLTFKGWIDDKRDFFNHIDLLLVTSRQEGFGLVVTDAIEHKVPVISFRIGGISEILPSQWMVDSLDIDGMVRLVNAFKGNYLEYYNRFLASILAQTRTPREWANSILKI